jgi:hypothetical protein
MIATLPLNLGKELSPEDLTELLEISDEEKKPIEVVLLEAAQERAAQRRARKSRELATSSR